MTSPPAQPTIADAVRLMDSLEFLPGHSKAISAGPPSHASLSLTECAASDAVRIPYRSSTLDSHAEHPYSQLHRSHNSTRPTSSEHASNSVRIPPLPAEIIYQIGRHLLHPVSATSPHHLNTSFPCAHAHAPYTPICTPTTPLPSTLVALSSASVAFRNTLAPLIWYTLVIKSPQHLPRLAALLKNYDTLSTRSSSPSATRQNPSPTSPSSTKTSESEHRFRSSDVGLRNPLSNIKSIVVSIPDKYPDLDQSFLISLLRSMSLPETHQLQHLYWSAEAAPHPAIWTLVAPSLRSLDVDGRTFYHGHKGWAGLERLESLRLVGYESTLLPGGVVALLQGQHGVNRGGESKVLVREMPEGMVDDEPMGSGVLSPVIELQHSTAASPRRVAQHLYLDRTPTISPTSTQTLPSTTVLHAQDISQSQNRLRHLSLSSSKTSILHQPALITSCSFSTITCLDIYAVTPESPLSQALISTSSTLTHLRLVLDISGAFANFNALWSDLTGKLPHLAWLEVDPMPQQNTAPSFWDFVEGC
ncbi:uncharacterized protein UTRI_00548 [Ustilago trichophora]|uniref:Uncharacterized protein n=1 Tax=Ustilago trichophora TaxID=86804 RepID=A0A5C3DV54_9BASI|nr:uncharacterized protein UTRI_00548 [Ustilago trichophora]